MSNFRTKAFGKWILAGEHSVLRGSPAIVFPLFSRWLEFEYLESQGSDLELQIGEGFGDEFRLLFWSVLEKACAEVGAARSQFKGTIKLSSNLQVGAGQGASASLCIAFARWFNHLGYIEKSEITRFARQMENIFHGESSGLDVAVVQEEKPLHFERNGRLFPLETKWQPQFYLSYSGKKGITYDCVQKVKALLRDQPEIGEKLDHQMKEAAVLCELALTRSEHDGFEILVNGVNKANECFEAWGLLTSEMKLMIENLKSNGAVACKPTGSGGGGFVLSLWRTTPPKELNLIPCFA